jgi:hypothetical protein
MNKKLRENPKNKKQKKGKPELFLVFLSFYKKLIQKVDILHDNQSVIVHTIMSRITKVTCPEQFYAYLCFYPTCLGAYQAGLLLRHITQLLPRFVQQNLTIHLNGKDVTIVNVLLSLRDYCDGMVTEFTKLIYQGDPRGRPLWLLESKRKASQDFLELFHELMMMADNNDPRVVEYQKRIMLEKAEAFHKSPYYLELGATLSNPARFANGWFEAHGILDDDGFLE